MSSLGRCAAENARGAAIFCRVHVERHAEHPGVLLLDDLNAGGLQRLHHDGLSPSAVVETSPNNFQSWIRLAAPGSTMPETVARAALLRLILEYGADPKAASTVQPGRLVGFTNRKPKHVRPDGSCPFVRLAITRPMFVAPAAADLVAAAACDVEEAQARRARGAPEKKRPVSCPRGGGLEDDRLDALHAAQKRRIMAEVAAGRRPAMSASGSEVDFAAAVAALQSGAEEAAVAAWLTVARPEKADTYGWRTVQAAADYLAGRDAVFHRR